MMLAGVEPAAGEPKFWNPGMTFPEAKNYAQKDYIQWLVDSAGDYSDLFPLETNVNFGQGSTGWSIGPWKLPRWGYLFIYLFILLV